MSENNVNSRHETAGGEDRCPECGATGVGGRAGCQALFDELSLQAYNDPGYARVRNLAFDAYCMQHVEPYCHSAKSYAAHLTRLCCGLEHDGNPVVYAAIQQWLNGARALEKPPVLSDRGHLTVVDVRAATTAYEHAQCVQVWARTVWTAYSDQQSLARSWIQEALHGKVGGRPEKRTR